MSAVGRKTLLGSGGPLIGFTALLAVEFTQEGRRLVSCGAEPSTPSDLRVEPSGKSVVSWSVLPSLSFDLLAESSEVLIILDPNHSALKRNN